MSDFIYSKKRVEKERLTKEIQSLYHQDKPLISEFHGDWGSLAVSDNLYNGFQLFETSKHFCVVIGGPVLCFQSNDFLQYNSGMIGTKAIFDRWLSGNSKWDEDLSGPFVVLIINKDDFEVNCITDLMSFIPVYSHQDATNTMLSTHVDLLAESSGQQDNLDMVSKVDFILHGVVTFPYTTYANLKQMPPASEHRLLSGLNQLKSIHYWVPEEKYQFNSIEEAAKQLRRGLINYVESITDGTSKIAQFISGGEDSRTLSGLLSKEHDRDAFIFLDQMNKEGKLAEKAAFAYGANFNLAIRNKLHYLEILPICSNLVGDGSQYFHAHTFGFHKNCKLNHYSAVFGGLFSDALLKGSRIKKTRGTGLVPFLPQFKRHGYSAAKTLTNPTFLSDVLIKLTKRRKAHLEYIKKFRNKSAEEWFELWPSSMNMNIPNLHANRRLFRSYEPFMANDVVKVSATVPQSWKLNRRLFHKAAKPLLKPTKWLLHGDGWLPYFPWYVNTLVRFVMSTYQQFGKRTGLIKGNQESWGDWSVVMKSQEWKKAIAEYADGIILLSPVLKEKELKQLFGNDSLNYVQKINLMQTLYFCNKSTK